MRNLKNVCLQYFIAFSNKNINILPSFFNAGVCLEDWNIKAYGFKEVIEANEKIFSDVNTIKVTPKTMYQDDNVVCCEIDILVNGEELINVIDVIEFDDIDYILKITAYKK
jgi:hypothetical protein